MLTLSILLYAIVLLMTIAAILRRDGYDLFNPLVIFLVYLFIQLGMSALVSTWFGFKGELSLPMPEFEGRYIQAVFLGILTTILIFVGSTVAGPRHFVPKYTTRILSATKTYAAVLIAFPIGYLSFWVLLQKNGGLEEFLRNREAWRGGGMTGQGIYMYPATTLLNVVALYNLGRVFTQSRSWIEKGIAMLIVLASLGPSMFLGFRGPILFPVVQGLVILHYCARRISPAAAVGAGALILTVFTTYGIYREIAVTPNFDVGDATRLVSQKPELALNVFLRSRGADVVANVIEQESVTGEYDFGPDSLIEFLTIWIPNAIWEDKPVPSHVRFTTYFFGQTLARIRDTDKSSFGGVSPTFVGEAYWHMGVFGVIVFALLWGILGRVAINTLDAGKDHVAFLVAYSAFWTFFAVSAEYIQGGAQNLEFACVSLIPLMILLTTSASRHQRIDATPSMTQAGIR